MGTQYNASQITADTLKVTLHAQQQATTHVAGPKRVSLSFFAFSKYNHFEYLANLHENI